MSKKLKSNDLITPKSIKTIIIPEGKVQDYIDGKLRKDTPEEYVRQNIEKRLVNEHKYKKEQIRVEYTLKVGNSKPRADIVIFPDDCENFVQENVKIIVECKKEKIDPHDRKEGVEQLKSYMSVCLNCEWGMWTNGLTKIVLRKVSDEKGKVQFVEYIDLPTADGKLENVDRPKREDLKEPVEDNLLLVFKTCHNHIYSTEGMQKQPAFFEFLKVIFCKIEDEKNSFEPLEFYVTSNELKSPDGQLTAKKRISKIFEKVKKKYSQIFEENDEIKLSPRTLSYVVSELQKYSVITTQIDVKGKAYEELVGANLRGDRGEFFTPRNVMSMAVRMINPRKGEKVLDSSCGTGGFLVAAMMYIINQFQLDAENKLGRPISKWSYEEKRTFDENASEIANDIFGFDINPDLVKSSIMNLLMSNEHAKNENVFRLNSLLPPHEWSDELKTNLAKALGIKKESIRNSKSIAWFDVIVTNPPFGSKIPIKDTQILSQFDLGYIWEKADGKWVKTDRLQTSVPPEQLFIERCLQLLKPGGRMAIVIPDSILGSPGLGYIRQWLIEHAKVFASIDLPADTFQPRNGTQTSVLIVQKKTEKELIEEATNGYMNDYDIFMSIVDFVGHDKRGNFIYKTDDSGNLILENVEIKDVIVDKNGEEVEVIKTKQKKVLNDQTVYVPKVFGGWKRKEGLPW
ncbi:Site-specific DNA-methyltransferase (adenine-specific) [Bacillus velezensis]|uniref:N-6 DNA methylase n=1 Tax=Bacillus subtilis group TaxID=653685 RepID=UPI000801A776|nr:MULTISPECIES: N-6 DNA methylase [Bacillus subtilis group]MEC0446166.1 N-6 DNA methylase [Bacillus velezensis]OBR31525.1 Site-specific DNA-methyltransferase (adenine-specific) [Bacillus velezensis]OCB92358.1 Site-specific DNA-methyltransferase (adenine-specific) [Bacillus velezensis]WPP36698.1 N-6 DNA methylase [Bacillus sonorensis]